MELDARTWSGLEYLESISGPGAIAEMVADFNRDLPSRLARMQQALAAGEASLLARLAHDLKSNSATMGVLELSALAARLEKQAQAGLDASLEALIAEVETLAPAALEALRERARRYPA